MCFKRDSASSTGGNIVKIDSLWIKKKRKMSILLPNHFVFSNNMTLWGLFAFVVWVGRDL